MLHLEKPSPTDSAYVTLREHTRMFTPTFLRALSLACCFHLTGFVLFHVQPFRIAQTSTQFPPVQVNIEMTPPNSAIYANVEVESSCRRTLPEPVLPKPFIPRLSLNSPSRAEVLPSEKPFPMTPIIFEEPDALIDEWIAFDPAPSSKIKAPQIRLLGALSNRLPILNTLPVSTFPLKKSSLKRLTYSVKIDDRTGTIFWYSAQSENGFTDEAEAILKSIRFEPLANGFVTEGQIELLGVSND